MNSSNYNGYQCPLCNVDLGGNPFGSKLCYDRQLDEILMAIFPRPEIDGALQQRREKRDAELNAPKITYAKGQRATVRRRIHLLSKGFPLSEPPRERISRTIVLETQNQATIVSQSA